MAKIEFEMKEAERTTRELIIHDIVDLEKSIMHEQKTLDNPDKTTDENILAAMKAINQIKLDALREALVNDDFNL